MGTRWARRPWGWATRSGAIEPGKRADLVLFDTRRPEWQALWNPVNNLIYNTDGRSVHTVVIDGRIVVDNSRQTFVDEARLFSTVQEIGEAPAGAHRHHLPALSLAHCVKEESMFFELRQYVVRPGQQKAWVKWHGRGRSSRSRRRWAWSSSARSSVKRTKACTSGSDASRARPSASGCTTSCTRATTGRTRSREVGTLIDREQIKVQRIMATPHSVIQ